MDYAFKATNLDLTEEITSYARKSLSPLEKLLLNSSAARADVELEFLQSEERTYRAELMISDTGLFRATARGRTLHEAVDLAGAELRAELLKRKDKRVHLVRRSALKVKEFLRGWRRRI